MTFRSSKVTNRNGLAPMGLPICPQLVTAVLFAAFQRYWRSFCTPLFHTPPYPGKNFSAFSLDSWVYG